MSQLTDAVEYVLGKPEHLMNKEEFIYMYSLLYILIWKISISTCIYIFNEMNWGEKT